MARPTDSNSPYRVSIHHNNGYHYASTQPARVNPKTGKREYRHVYWGTVTDDLKFIPGKNYLLESIEERGKLIFPEGWDLSEIDKLSGRRKTGRPVIESQDENRLYGDIWLLEKIAEQTGLRFDLMSTFDGDKEKVDTLMTLALYLLCGRETYNQLASWQRIAKTPWAKPLSSPYITRFTQSITEQDRMAFLRLRARRLRDNELCAVDSTSCSSYGHSLADIHYGRNKEHLPLPQTLEVVVYTLDGHMPVYYRSFAGNTPDSRSLAVILKDLKQAGMKRIILITDRGYESIRNLELYIDQQQRMIMGTKTGQKHVRRLIDEFGNFGHHPDGMQVDPEERIYYLQKDMDYQIEGQRDNVKKADNLKLNLYFDPIRRGNELTDLDIALAAQKEALEASLVNQITLDDDETLKQSFRFYRLKYNAKTRILEDFSLDENKVIRCRREAGFFANTTHGLDMDALSANRHYRLRDEQEKYFALMKGVLGADRQRTSTETGKIGRSFILFVAQIMGCYLSHVRKTKLAEQFHSVADVLNEMRPIRCIEHPNTKAYITPFVGKQVDICEALGFEIPEGCAPDYVVKKTNKGKRGRPRKNQLVVKE